MANWDKDGSSRNPETGSVHSTDSSPSTNSSGSDSSGGVQIAHSPENTSPDAGTDLLASSSRPVIKETDEDRKKREDEEAAADQQSEATVIQRVISALSNDDESKAPETTSDEPTSSSRIPRRPSAQGSILSAAPPPAPNLPTPSASLSGADKTTVDYAGMSLSMGVAAVGTWGVAGTILAGLGIAGLLTPPFGTIAIAGIAAVALLVTVGAVCIGLAVKFYRDSRKSSQQNKAAQKAKEKENEDSSDPKKQSRRSHRSITEKELNDSASIKSDDPQKRKSEDPEFLGADASNEIGGSPSKSSSSTRSQFSKNSASLIRELGELDDKFTELKIKIGEEKEGFLKTIKEHYFSLSETNHLVEDFTNLIERIDKIKDQEIASFYPPKSNSLSDADIAALEESYRTINKLWTKASSDVALKIKEAIDPNHTARQLAQQQTQLESIRREQAEAEAELRDMRDRVQEEENKAKEAANKVESKKEELERLEQERKKAAQENRNVEEKVASLENESHQLNQTIIVNNGALENIENEKKRAARLLQAIRPRLEAMQKEYSTREKSLQEKTEELSAVISFLEVQKRRKFENIADFNRVSGVSKEEAFTAEQWKAKMDAHDLILKQERTITVLSHQLQEAKTKYAQMETQIGHDQNENLEQEIVKLEGQIAQFEEDSLNMMGEIDAVSEESKKYYAEIESSIGKLHEIFFDYHREVGTKEEEIAILRKEYEKKGRQEGLIAQHQYLVDKITIITKANISAGKEAQLLKEASTLEHAKLKEERDKLKAAQEKTKETIEKAAALTNALKDKGIDPENIPAVSMHELVIQHLNDSFEAMYGKTNSSPFLSKASDDMPLFSKDQASIISDLSDDDVTALSPEKRKQKELKNYKSNLVSLITAFHLPRQPRVEAAKKLCEFLVNEIIEPLYKKHKDDYHTLGLSDAAEKDAKWITQALTIVYSLSFIIGDRGFTSSLFNKENGLLPLGMWALQSDSTLTVLNLTVVNNFYYHLAHYGPEHSGDGGIHDFMKLAELWRESAKDENKAQHAQRLAYRLSDRHFIDTQISKLHDDLMKLLQKVESKETNLEPIRYKEDIYAALLPSWTETLKSEITGALQKEVEEIYNKVTRAQHEFSTDTAEEVVGSTNQVMAGIKDAISALGKTITIKEATLITRKIARKEAIDQITKDPLAKEISLLSSEEKIYKRFLELSKTAENASLLENPDYDQPDVWKKARNNALTLQQEIQQLLSVIKERNTAYVSTLGSENGDDIQTQIKAEQAAVEELATLIEKMTDYLAEYTQKMLKLLLLGQFTGMVNNEQRSGYVKEQLGAISKLTDEKYNSLLAILPIIHERDSVMLMRGLLSGDMDGNNPNPLEIALRIQDVVAGIQGIIGKSKKNAKIRGFKEHESLLVEKITKIVAQAQQKDFVKPKAIAEKIIQKMLQKMQSPQAQLVKVKEEINNEDADTPRAKAGAAVVISIDGAADEIIKTKEAEINKIIDATLDLVVTQKLGFDDAISKKLNNLRRDAEAFVEKSQEIALEFQKELKENSLENLEKILQVTSVLQPMALRLIKVIKELSNEVQNQKSAEMVLVAEAANAFLVTMQEMVDNQIIIKNRVEQRIEKIALEVTAQINALTLRNQYDTDMETILAELVKQCEEMIVLTTGVASANYEKAINTAKNNASIPLESITDKRITQLLEEIQQEEGLLYDVSNKIYGAYAHVKTLRQQSAQQLVEQREQQKAEEQIKQHDGYIKNAFDDKRNKGGVNQSELCDILLKVYDYYVAKYKEAEKKVAETIYPLIVALIALAYHTDSDFNKQARERYKKIRSATDDLEKRLASDLKEALNIKVWTFWGSQYNQLKDRTIAYEAVMKNEQLKKDGLYTLFVEGLQKPQSDKDPWQDLKAKLTDTSPSAQAITQSDMENANPENAQSDVLNCSSESEQRDKSIPLEIEPDKIEQPSKKSSFLNLFRPETPTLDMESMPGGEFDHEALSKVQDTMPPKEEEMTRDSSDDSHASDDSKQPRSRASSKKN